MLEAHNGERVVKIYDGYAYENDRFREVNEKIRRCRCVSNACRRPGCRFSS